MELLCLLGREPHFTPMTTLARDLDLPVKRGRYHGGTTVGDLVIELNRRGFAVVTKNGHGDVGMVASVTKEAWVRAKIGASNYWAAVHGSDNQE
jgi:hypothetical protein